MVIFKSIFPLFILLASFSITFCIQESLPEVPGEEYIPNDPTCEFPCSSCISGVCHGCPTGYSLVSGVCEANSISCASNQYLSTGGSCIDCSSDCSTCSASGCSVCNSGYYLYQGSCFSGCPSSTYPDGTNCFDCYSGCTSCSSTSSSACLSCQTGLYFYNNQCLQNCPNGYTPDAQNYCQAQASCSTGCLHCSGPTVCTTCDVGYYLFNNACGTTCPTGTFKVDSTRDCENCQSNCDTCSGTGSCNICSSGYKLKGGQCVQNCPSNCDTCSSTSSCSLCSNGYYLSGGQCVQICPQGTYADGTNRICAGCPQGCADCSSSSVCSSCSQNYFLLASVCGTSCPTGKYEDSTNWRCGDCPVDCESCSVAGICSVCDSGTFNSGGQCVGSCPAKTYGDSTARQCKACPTSNCDSCPNGNQCETCSSGFKLYNGACYSACPSFTYASASVCEPCLTDCKTCSDQSTCSECGNSKVLFQNQCLNSCPEAYYNDNGVCKQCDARCQVCTGTSQCSTCKVKYFLEGGVCKDCKAECASCTALNTCQTCEPNYLFYNAACLDSCPVGTFASGVKCENCATGCVDCTGLSSCSICKDGYYLDNGICHECDASCAKCTSQTLCQTCEPDYVFYNQSCPTTCPPGTWNSTKTSCPTGCATCTDTTMCQTCIFGYNLYTGTVCTIDVNEEQAKQVEQVTKATEAAGTTSSAVGSVYGFLNSGDPSAMFMGTLAKMLQYVKYINIVYPPKIVMMFEAQNKVNKTENSTSFITRIQDNIKGAFYNAPLPGTFGHYQAHSSFASNFLQPLLTLSAIAFLIILLEVFTRLTSKSSKFHQIMMSVLDILKWNLFLIMFCGMYGDIIFFSSLEFRTSKFDDLTSTMSFLICVSVNVLAVLVLVRLVQVNLNLKSSRKNRIAKNHQTQSMQDTVTKWKNYKPFFEAYKNYTFSQQSFMLFFIIRVSLFYSVVAYLQDSPKAQVVLINLISVGIILYLVIARPFTKVVNTLNQVVFECNLLAFNACALMLTFYDGDTAHDFKKRESIGNVMIIINMVAGIVSMLFICLKLLVLLKELYQDWRKSKLQKNSKGTSANKKSDNLEITVDNSLTTSGQILTTNSTLNHSQMTLTSDLTISNIEQTTIETPYGRNTRPHHRLIAPPVQQTGGRISYYPNFHQNIRQVLNPEQTVMQSLTSASSRKPSHSIPEESISSRKSSKIRKSKKNKKLQEELRKLEEKRQQQINMTRGMYSTEAKKKRRPANNLDTFNN